MTSNRCNSITQKRSPERRYEALLSKRELEEKFPIKKAEIKTHINFSTPLNNVDSTNMCSRSISFRLNPTTNLSKSVSPKPSSSSTTMKTVTTTTTIATPKVELTANKIFKSEIYYNPKLQEKMNKFQPILHVDLSYSCLVDQDMSTIVKQIIIGKKCTELWLYGNSLTSIGASILGSSLINNSVLKSLDLSFNRISDVGVFTLTQALTPNQNSSLKFLYLSKNGISNDGANYLAEMLKTNQTIKELWLSNNEIGDEGIKKLAYTLAYHNKTLKFLSLTMNVFITDLCIDNLIEMLEHNQTLKELWIVDCNLTEQGKTKLQEKANRKKNLKIDL